MGKLRFTSNYHTSTYTVCEGGVQFTMPYSYFVRLQQFIRVHYRSYYREETGAVLEWYREHLSAPEKKAITVRGMSRDTGFFADPSYED